MQFIASARGAARSTTINTGTTLNIQAGDMLVAFVAGDIPTSATLAVAEDDASNSFTSLGLTTQWWAVGCAYLESAAASSGATIRATLSGVNGTIELIVLQFRPDSGETVTFGDGPASAQAAWGQNATSGQLSTSEPNTWWVGGASTSAQALSGNQIGGAASDGTVEGATNYFDVSYRELNASQSNVSYANTNSGSTWGAQLMYFTIETSSSGGHPTASRFRGMHRNNSVRYA